MICHSEFNRASRELWPAMLEESFRGRATDRWFEEILRPMAMQILYSQLRDDERVSYVLAEVYFKVFTSLEKIDPKKNIGSYCQRITYSMAGEHWRQYGRTRASNYTEVVSLSDDRAGEIAWRD